MKKLLIIIMILLNASQIHAMGRVRPQKNYDTALMISVLSKVKSAMRLNPDMETPALIVYEDQRRLDVASAFAGLAKGTKAFYSYRHNSIYTSKNNLNMDILQHELCHAVLDHELDLDFNSIAAEWWCQDMDVKLK